MLSNASKLFLALAWPKQLSNNLDNLSNQEETQNQGNTTAPKPQETMVTTTQSAVGRSHTPNMDRGKNQPTKVEINIQPRSTSPEPHTISNVIAGELTQAEKGKEQTLNL